MRLRGHGSLRGALLGVLALGVGGCGESHSLMPLQAGSAATYLANYGLSEGRVESIRVGRTVSVAGVRGNELTGPLGVSKLAWKDDVLYADQLANAWFSPSLPILAEDLKPRQWSGLITAMGRSQRAMATLTFEKDKDETVGSRRLKAVNTHLVVNLPGGTIAVDSWYVPDLGMVRQEQRTNGKLLIQLRMVTAPP